MAGSGVLWGRVGLSVAVEGTGWVLHGKYYTVYKSIAFPPHVPKGWREKTAYFQPLGKTLLAVAAAGLLLFAQISRKPFGLPRNPQRGAPLFLVSDCIAK